MGPKHPFAHTAVAVVWEVVAVVDGLKALVEQSAGVLVADIEGRVLGDQLELDPDCHVVLELSGS